MARLIWTMTVQHHSLRLFWSWINARTSLNTSPSHLRISHLLHCTRRLHSRQRHFIQPYIFDIFGFVDTLHIGYDFGTPFFNSLVRATTRPFNSTFTWVLTRPTTTSQCSTKLRRTEWIVLFPSCLSYWPQLFFTSPHSCTPRHMHGFLFYLLTSSLSLISAPLTGLSLHLDTSLSLSPYVPLCIWSDFLCGGLKLFEFWACLPAIYLLLFGILSRTYIAWNAFVVLAISYTTLTKNAAKSEEDYTSCVTFRGKYID